jgi:hypothetical protein
VPGFVSGLFAGVPPEDVLTELGDDRVLGRLGVALAVGLLVGFQRQYAKHDAGADLFAGARSFGLIGLIGGLGALLADRFDNVTIFAATLIVVGAVIAIGHLSGVRDGSHGITTELAAIITFMAGALAGMGELSLAVGVSVATTALLAAKPYTRSFVAHIDRQDVEATVQFAVLVALVLPVLPREPIGPAPFDAASPFKIGLMVVFILGLSFLGYVLIKIVGPRRGIGLTGILGGLVSATAVTLTVRSASRTPSASVRRSSSACCTAPCWSDRRPCRCGWTTPGSMPGRWHRASPTSMRSRCRWPNSAGTTVSCRTRLPPTRSSPPSPRTPW